MADTLLAIHDLHAGFRTLAGEITVLSGISLSVHAGQTLGIVGESGCGKSVTAMWVMRLLASPPAFVRTGSIHLEGRDLLALSESAMRGIRGNRVSMIFQEPMTSLNPVLRIGGQVAESLRLHQGLSRKAALERALEILTLVGIPDPARRMQNYPHEISGGMRQRVMIAIALACRPKLLIADEPTTALDVTIQAQILYLMNRLKRETGTAIMLITHDLGVVAEMADTVAVMYAGSVVEQAPVAALFGNPLHPYTLGLLASIPRLDTPLSAGRRLPAIPGVVPRLSDLGPGCAFSERCGRAFDVCRAKRPELHAKSPAHSVRCFLYA